MKYLASIISKDGPIIWIDVIGKRCCYVTLLEDNVNLLIENFDGRFKKIEFDDSDFDFTSFDDVRKLGYEYVKFYKTKGEYLDDGW